MAFFDNFGKKAKDVAGFAFDKAKDVAEIAADKAKDAAQTTKLNVAISSEQRELDKNYRAIGQWFVSEFQGEAPETIRDVLAAVEQNKAKIAELEAQKAALKEDDEKLSDVFSKDEEPKAENEEPKTEE